MPVLFQAMRTLTTFKTDGFNTSEPREDFVNPGCFGDDVAIWLMRELNSRGVRTAGSPQQEDFGWYFTYRVDDTEHNFVIGYRPGDAGTEGDWIGWIERKRGLIGSALLGRTRGVRPAAVQVIHDVLSASPQVRDIRWYRNDHDESRNVGAERPL